MVVAEESMTVDKMERIVILVAILGAILCFSIHRWWGLTNRNASLGVALLCVIGGITLAAILASLALHSRSREKIEDK